MNYNKVYAASTSLLLLAGCSSSGDNASATLAAVAAPPIATPSPSQPTAAGSSAFSSGQVGVEALPVFDPDSDNNVQTTNIPVFNSDGSVGSSTVRSSDDGQETLSINVNGEDFTVTNSQSQSGFIVSDDGRLTGLGSDQTGVPNLRGVVNSAVFFQTENVIENRTLPNAEEITNIGISIDGALTPVADLPAQARYSGGYFTTSPDQAEGAQTPGEAVVNGNFTATATFGQVNILEGNFPDRDGSGGFGLNATIQGNTFEGQVRDNAGNGSIDVNGGFFGQNAEAIAGAGTGVVEDEQFSIGFVGSRTDTPPTN